MINFVSSEDSLFGEGKLMGSLCKSKQLFQLKYTNTINNSGSDKSLLNIHKSSLQK